MMDAREWLRRNADRGSLDAGTNTAWGLTSHLLRGRLGGRFAVAASASQQIETQINALADVLAWTHWTGAAGSPVSVVVGHSAKKNVIVEALQTLRHALIGRRHVEILVQRSASGSFVVNDQMPYDFADHPKASEYAGYMESWRLAEPSGLAEELLEALGDDRVRLYPQLSKSATVNPHWSVRLDGLQIGIVGATTGWLDVGKTSAAGNNSLARSKWLASGAPSDQIDLTLSRESIERGVRQIRAFAKALEVRATPGLASALLDHGQPERALESAILRGAVPVEVRDSTLGVPHPHRLIVRASQIPTRWAQAATSARYIDAIMAGADVPWILELKVPGGGTRNGYGAYLRKGITQAVLYRHFIRTARPLHPWLRAGGMSAEVAHAALVFPAISDRDVANKVAQRLGAHRAVAEEFDVAVLTVPAGPPVPADDR